MKAFNIYCIVVTYNGAAWVKKCFGSLLSCGLPVKILAIDNASSDNTVQLLRTDFATVQVIETGSNLGFGKANNIGLKMALDNDADYIFLLNQDAWLQPGCIEKLISCFQSNLQMGIISPVHLNAAGDNFDKHFAGYTNEQHCPGFVTDRFFGREKTLYPIKFINAAAWMLSRNTLEKVGGSSTIASNLSPRRARRGRTSSTSSAMKRWRLSTSSPLSAKLARPRSSDFFERSTLRVSAPASAATTLKEQV